MTVPFDDGTVALVLSRVPRRAPQLSFQYGAAFMPPLSYCTFWREYHPCDPAEGIATAPSANLLTQATTQGRSRARKSRRYQSGGNGCAPVYR